MDIVGKNYNDVNMSIMKRLFAILFSGLLACSLRADVVLWQMSDAASYDGHLVFIAETFSSSPNAYVNVESKDQIGVRLKAINTSTGESSFLPAYVDGYGFDDESAEFGLFTFNESGGNGTAWTQSSLAGAEGEQFNYVAELLLFDTDYENYSIIGQSEIATYNDIYGKHTYEIASLAPLTATPYEFSSFTSIPEPNSGLLTSVGLVVFMLKRKKY